jgi:replicative DNA helicase
MPICDQVGICAESFYVSAHQTIYQTMALMMEEDRVIDLVSLSEFLKHSGKLDYIGGAFYLDQLVDTAPTVAHLEYHADAVRQKELMRRVIETCREYQDKAQSAERGDSLIVEMSTAIADLQRTTQKETTTAEQFAEQCQIWQAARKHGFSGIPFPFQGLNHVLGGSRGGNVYVWAAPTSQGKSSLVAKISRYAAERGYPVARVELEMTAKRSINRCVCDAADLSLSKLDSGKFTDEEFERATQAGAAFCRLPIYINDHIDGLTALMGWVRMQKLKHGIKMLVVDYLDLLVTRKKDETQNDATSRHVKMLKRLAKELDISIHLVVQMNRSWQKERRLPRLSDLRDSGTIEQHAYAVIFIYADPEREAEHTDELRHVCVDVQKQQDGPIGALDFVFLAPRFRFYEMGDWRAIVAGEAQRELPV